MCPKCGKVACRHWVYNLIRCIVCDVGYGRYNIKFLFNICAIGLIRFATLVIFLVLTHFLGYSILSVFFP